MIRKRSFPRLLAGVALAASGLLALNACSATPSSDSSSAGPIQGNVTIWSWSGPTQGLQAAVPAFEAANPGTKVDVQDVGNPAIWTKITTGMAAGGSGLPDIMNIGVDYISSYIEKFPTGLENLSDQGADDLKSDFAAGPWSSGTGADGKVYGLPYEANPAATFYRADLFQAAGIDPTTITNWDQLINAGVTLKAKTGASLFAVDKSATTSAANWYQTLMALQGSFYYNDQGNITLNDEAGVTALSLLKKANDLGIVADVSGNDQNKIQSGEVPVAVMDGPAWMVGSIEDNYPDMAGKWGIRPEVPVETGGTSSALVGATYLTMSATSQNKATAWAFMKYALGTMEGEQALYDGGGLFPSYLPLLQSSTFNKTSTFYAGTDNPNKLFADSLSADTTKLNYTSDYAQALKAYDDAQTRVMLSGADPKAELDKAAEQVASQTGRTIANG